MTDPAAHAPRRRRAVARRPAPAFSPRDVLFVLFRHKRLAALTFAAVAALAAAAAALLPPQYRSTAEMKVKLGRESVGVDATAAIGTTVMPMQDRSIELNGELGLLGSRSVAEAVAARVGPSRLLDGDDGPTVAEAADHLEDEVAVGIVPKSPNLTVAYEAADPALARDVVAAYVAAFLDLRADVYRSPGSADFFAEQLARSRGELGRLRREIRDLQDRTGVADVAVQRGILLNRIGGLEAQADAAQAAVAAAEARAAGLVATLDGMPEELVTRRTTGSPNSSLEALRERLAELRIEGRDLAARYVEGSPTVAAKRQQIEEAEALVAAAEAAAGQETVVSANRVREELALRLEEQRGQIAAERAKLDRTAVDLAEARGGLGDLNAAQVELDDLERRAAIVAANERQYAETFATARTDRAIEAAKITNISVYQPASLPAEPDGPDRPLLLGLGLILAALAAGGSAFAAEALDHTVKRPEEVAALAGGGDPSAEAVVSIPRLRSGTSVARGPAARFDEFSHALRALFGTAGQSGGRVARTAGGATGGIVRQLAHVAGGTVKGVLWLVGFALLSVGNAVVWLVMLPLALFRDRDATEARLARLREIQANDARGTAGLALADGPLVAEYEAIQDEDAGEVARPEPRAAPDRRFGRGLRLLAYGVRRDLAAWFRRDDRPNLQVADRQSRTAAADAVRRAARGVVEQLAGQLAGDRLPPALAVVGARPGSGTTTVAAHVAAVLAERDADDPDPVREGADLLPVLLLRPTEGRGGADDADPLAGVEPTAVQGLSRLELGTLRTREVARAVDAAKGRWRHVVLDLPPVFADVAVGGVGEGVREDAGPRLAAVAGAAVLVVEAERLRREAAGRAADRLDRAGADVRLVVLNKRVYHVPGWLYARA